MTHSSDIQKNDNVPVHVAVIMDGNGRWACKRGLPRRLGHKKGSEAARDIVKNAANAGIKYLTLFGFSSENWNRPKDEIFELMKLLRHYLRSQTADLHKNNVRLSVIGERSAFDDDIIALIKNAEDLTKDNDKIHVIIALNYGGRSDIAQATQYLIEQAIKTGEKPDVSVIEKSLSNALQTAGIPDPDLLIRTSGEQRISNFLLWQCAYTEMVFTQTLWPDFNEKDLNDALNEYAGRDRRFGALKQSEG
ncbi:MAG: di-trans,poly-cis-decaprenylcistransferase [Zetaproteobacteria bacterium]|nr:MAG: di-trans,poly-cis-decaprenylcistransferase [Zetaproteobacteria bacterium]